MKKVLIIGATGAMGSYLTEKLAADGVMVDAVSLDMPEFTPKNVNRIQVKDAQNPGFVYDITRNHYDAIVDFMVYNTIKFRNTYKKYLDATDQYVFLSSCRVYANEENPIKENSPQLLDVTTDTQLLFSDDYCMHKARSEDALLASGRKNWTIVRPSTTYSRRRCQLLTLERVHLLPYMRSGAPVPLFEGAKDIPASLTWGGDVADMIKNLLFKESSLGEDYNVTSSECRTWAEIAEYYHELFGLNYDWVDELTYQRFKNTNFNPAVDLPQVWQLRYARMFNRVYDNSKMLKATGLKQENFKTLYEGLKHERPTILAED